MLPGAGGAGDFIAIDTSSAQGLDLTASFLLCPSATHVVPKAYIPAERIPASERKPYAPDFTTAQVVAARSLGRTVNAVYGWAYGDLDPAQSARDWLATAWSAAVRPLRMCWVDAETYTASDGTVSWPNVAWLQAALAELDREGQECGIYTGPWFVSGYLGGTTAFAARAAWLAFYNFLADLGSLPRVGGWDSYAGHQFSAAGIDQSVFAGRYR